MPPPSYKVPRKQADVIAAFYADPFDPRFRTDQKLTPLGAAVQMYGELRRLLKREAPDALEFIDQTDTDPS